jgi:hypothetical protein
MVGIAEKVNICQTSENWFFWLGFGPVGAAERAWGELGWGGAGGGVEGVVIYCIYILNRSTLLGYQFNTFHNAHHKVVTTVCKRLSTCHLSVPYTSSPKLVLISKYLGSCRALWCGLALQTYLHATTGVACHSTQWLRAASLWASASAK